MADFQAANRNHFAGPEHAWVYLVSSQGFGITAATVTASSMQIYTATVPFKFQGVGQIEASIPPGTTALQNGVQLGEAILLPPASGSYSAGNHPRVQFKTTSVIAATIAATSVLLVQY